MLGEAGKQDVPKILDLKSSSARIFSEIYLTLGGPEYTFSNTCFGMCWKAPYLGVTQDANLRWNHHRHELSSKATKTLNLIKRIFWFCGEDTKCLPYKTLVRPKLEHASVVWDPHYLSDVNKLENIQRAAAPFRTGRSHNQGIMNILQV